MGFDFSGRRIMVFGASSGIGEAVALRLSGLGASVVLVARSEDKLQALRARMPFPERHIVIPFDAVQFQSYGELFDRAVGDGTKLSGLVYTAGIAKAIPLRVLSNSDFEEVFRPNYVGFVYAVEYYAKRKYSVAGSVVGISAINMHYPHKCMTLYAASKAAIEASVRCLALELSDRGTRINAVVPGAVDTNMARSVNPDLIDEIAGRQLLGLESADQVADAILFLLSDFSSAITGRSLFVDGGRLGQ